MTNTDTTTTAASTAPTTPDPTKLYPSQTPPTDPPKEPPKEPPPVEPPKTPDPPKTSEKEPWKEYVDDPAKTPEQNAAAKAEHDKTKPQEKPAEPKPLTKADLVLPEGFTADDKTQDSFIEIANKYSFSKEAVDALVKLQADVQKGLSEKGKSDWETTQADWKKAAETDKDIGGAKLQPALANISKLIDQYGDDEFRAVMDLTGAGNHPAFIRMLNKVASKVVQEGGPVSPGNPTVMNENDIAAKLYPSHSKGK